VVCTEVLNGKGVEDEIKVIFYAVYVFRAMLSLLLFISYLSSIFPVLQTVQVIVPRVYSGSAKLHYCFHMHTHISFRFG